jgi:hypothetical protein
MATPTTQSTRRQTSDLTPGAKRALWGGVLVSLLFTGLIWWAGGRLDRIKLLPDQGASWYYWKLPEPTFWSRLTAWGFYALHQLASWGLIYYAQTRVKRYTKGLHRVNVAALGTNAFFILLHFVQTHLWYDGLAQDVSIWTSQGSVILMLVAILLMENKRRGLFWGKKAPIPKDTMNFVRKYHGYVFSWAVVYTFWYHPMVATSGHLIGFLYMFLLMMQGSLFLTRLHVNRWWMAVQEVSVVIHGTLVAVMQGNGLWPMFFFGFAGVFVLTQMHGLRLKAWIRWTILALYVGGALLTYGQLGWARLNEIVRIPLIEYLAVAVLALVITAGLRLAEWIQRRQVLEGEGSAV